jgi:hypothetical protein
MPDKMVTVWQPYPMNCQTGDQGEWTVEGRVQALGQV